MALWLNLPLLAFGTLASLLIAYTDIGADISYPFLFGDWSPVDSWDWQVIAILAALMIGISIGLARAYQSPRPQVVATFDYAYLVFATFWGFAFFEETPDSWTLLGMALFVAAGMIVPYANARVEEEPATLGGSRIVAGLGEPSELREPGITRPPPTPGTPYTPDASRYAPPHTSRRATPPR